MLSLFFLVKYNPEIQKMYTEIVFKKYLTEKVLEKKSKNYFKQKQMFKMWFGVLFHVYSFMSFIL